jgi:hypothetical protein
MFQFSARPLVISLFAAAQVGCGESKVDQCNAVISSYNEVGTAVRQSFGDGTDPDAVAAHAKGIGAAVGKLEKISLSDASVKASRDALVTTFRQYEAHVSEMAEVVRDSADPAKGATVETRLPLRRRRATRAKPSTDPAIRNSEDQGLSVDGAPAGGGG